MHSPTETDTGFNTNAPVEKTSESSAHDTAADESSQNFDRCLWPSPQWQTFVPTAPETYLWSQNSPQPAPFQFGSKPMVASAPVTPDVIPYHGKYTITSL